METIQNDNVAKIQKRIEKQKTELEKLKKDLQDAEEKQERKLLKDVNGLVLEAVKSGLKEDLIKLLKAFNADPANVMAFFEVKPVEISHQTMPVQEENLNAGIQ